ncbi:MAG: hypothetical protein HC888_00520 [Candidatus Competibacteraceae bacterium]|nr:hypothetical protein [Candidatus Competibacteraceae bacterium]
MTKKSRASILDYLLNCWEIYLSADPPEKEEKRESFIKATESCFQVLRDDDIEMFISITEKDMISGIKRDGRKLEIMLLTMQPPKACTDVEFLSGHCNGNQFGQSPMSEKIGNYYRKVAESEGQNVKGKVYLSGLARYPGDPKAWVADRGDVTRVCEERNWGCTGLVETKTTGEPVI